MADFFDNIEWEAAQRMEPLARLSLELREAGKGVLRHYGVDSADALAARVASGECDEHPAWEHVLALRVLHDTRESVRRMIVAMGRDDGEVPPWHLQLAAMLAADYAGALDGTPATSQDALSLVLKSGVTLEVHVAAPDAYSLRWHVLDAAGVRREAGIDTAPVHSGLATSPNHLHLADGRVQPDPLTRPGAAPADNLRAVLDALLANPRYALEG